MSKNLSQLSGRQGLKDNLFDKYGEITKGKGTPSKEELAQLADEFLFGKANTYGAITAYDFMKPENKDKEIYICNGSACLCAGTQNEVFNKISENFQSNAIGHMTCLGRCHENSAFHFRGNNYSGSDLSQLDKILKDHTSNEDNYNVYGETEVLTKPLESVDQLVEDWHTILQKDPTDVLSEIKNSNIRGRGGAGFPMGIKWESCRMQENDTKFVICNADEGDPGAYSDRYLLEKRPYHVLFGMMVAGYCIGAHWGVLYIRAEYPESVRIIQNAIEDLKSRGAFDHEKFPFHWKVIEAKGAYICGEETALINSIEGQRPEVRTRPPYPTVQGLFNKPTVVNNVETLAAVHWILKNGGEKYAGLGTDKSSGTKLICLDGHFSKPGIYEVEMGTPLLDVFEKMGGGFNKPIKAVQIGGPLGGIVPASKFNELSIDFESFSNAGFLLGHASVVSIPEDFPMIKYMEHLLDFAAFESCGKCFPCRLGTTRGKELIQQAIHQNHKIDQQLFDDLLHTLEEGSLCAHGGGIPLPLRNALTYFNDELSTYFTKN